MIGQFHRVGTGCVSQKSLHQPSSRLPGCGVGLVCSVTPINLGLQDYLVRREQFILPPSQDVETVDQGVKGLTYCPSLRSEQLC